MNIPLKVKRDFERAMIAMGEKYGEDFELLNGFHESQLNFSDFIFLSAKAPYLPISQSGITAIVTRYFKKAGISSNGRHMGPHALRSTFASELLAEKVPYDAIRVILGHTDPESTRFYTKMSIEDLRTCALEVPPPSGLFADYLKGVRA